MSCPTCNSQSFPLVIQNTSLLFQPSCSSTPPQCGVDAQDIKGYEYRGVPLTCTNVYSGLNMEEVIKRLNDKICAVLGDYTTYNKFCLDDINAITTQQQFVESISEYVCTLRTDFTTFTTVTFPAHAQEDDARLDAIELPSLVSPASSILVTDTYLQVLTKLAASITDIYNNKLNISTVDWDACFVVATSPITIAQGFSTLSSEICSLKADMANQGIILPTFNNTGSCLPAPLTSADSLSDTVNKIKTRLCSTPTFDINNLTWGCISKPNNTTTDLQAALQSILTQLTYFKQNFPVFNSQFVVLNVNDADLCQGKSIGLVGGGGGGTDRYVAATASDLLPGTLEDKLLEGIGITLDKVTTPGKIIVKSTAIGTDEKVKSASSDTVAGYLDSKIKGATDTDSGLSIAVTLDNTDKKIQVKGTFDGGTMWEYLLAILDADPEIKADFCERVMSCLPDCIIPPNVSVVYNTSANTPAAPTSGIVDDTANTFNWTNNPAFTALTEYEQTLDGGTTYTALSAKPIAGLTGSRAVGQVGVRVKAIGTNPASPTLFNSVAFT